MVQHFTQQQQQQLNNKKHLRIRSSQPRIALARLYDI